MCPLAKMPVNKLELRVDNPDGTNWLNGRALAREDDVAACATIRPLSTKNRDRWGDAQCRSWLMRHSVRLHPVALLAVLLPIVSIMTWAQERPVGPIAKQDSAQTVTANQQASSGAEIPREEVIPTGHVVVDGRAIVDVFEPVGNLTPEQRATGITNRIIAAARDGGTSAEETRIQSHDGWSEIFAGNQLIMAVTDADAKMAGKPRQRLAAEDAERIRQAIVSHRREHSWRMLLRGVFQAMGTSLVLMILLWVTRTVRCFVRGKAEKYIHATTRLESKSTWHSSLAYLGPMLLTLGAAIRWLFILALIQVYLTVTLSFFPSTRDISVAAAGWVFSQLATLARSGVDYLPNLFVIAAIVLVFYYLMRLVRVVFGEIRKGDLQIKGFYADWAQPTEKLVRMLIFVLAAIVAFPYLPGAKSPAFQGISIFVGVLLSLGSSSAVANAIAGVILTYMRSFLVGDWVQIGDITGEVVEKTLLVTRVLTPKAEIITIPNATVMGGSVKNYSVEGKKAGVIFHTTVTIGYDAPWRTVHHLLLEAALATQHVLRHPAPFVLQSSLEDFYVTYELNAYTSVPHQMLTIFSELHQNIQDRFNEAGVEICSPHFSSLRDGNTIAIPEQYRESNYSAPGFRLKATEGKNQTTKAAGA